MEEKLENSTPVSHVGRVLDLANKLAAQVDHCLLGYAIHRQNGLDIKESMLQLRIVCNEFQSEYDALPSSKMEVGSNEGRADEE